MLIFDCHCDTLGKWTDKEKDTHVNPRDMRNGYIQVFAAFSGTGYDKWGRVKSLIKTYENLLGFKKIKFREDFENLSCGINSMLSIEGGECIEDKMERLDELYKMGVRIFSLTWNHNNLIAGAAMDLDMGLTRFGIEVIKRAEKLGITVDLSHAGEKSFYQTLEISEKPLVLSHSNSKAVCPHKRNITDAQFLALIKNKGCVGINFYPPFLSENKASIEDVIRHIDHFLSLGGEENVGIGTDFDGIESLPDGICKVRGIYTLCEKLTAIYGDNVSEKIMGKNFLRVLGGNIKQNYCKK